MKDRSVDLAVRVTAKSDAGSVFDDTGSAAKRMGDSVDTMSKKADDATSRIDRTAEASDNMASRSSQAAGGLGDLGAALAGLPGPLGSVGAGMEAAAMPVMGLVGASDLLNLAMTSNVVTTGRARVATIAHAVTAKTMTAVTKAQTLAQRALNLAMRANPIGIAITAAVVLVGLFVTLYKKSDTFRSIVQAVGRAGERALGWIIDKGRNLVDKFRDLREVAGVVKEWVGDRLSAGFEKFQRAASTALDLVMVPINLIKDSIEWIIDKLASIEMPDFDLPDIPGLGRTSANGSLTGGLPVSPRGGTTVIIQGALDPDAVARQVGDIVYGRGRRLGLPT